jgi:hypothetical protein
MAKPLARSATSSHAAIPLLEEAVHLLRRAPLATLVCHLLGTAPFALALLLFWNDVNNLHTADATVARESTVLALLLVWMNSWRAVFAGRLRRQVSATADTPWTWRRIWNLVAGQAFLGATKLIVLPLAAVTIFGFAWTVAFYRSSTALADRPDLDPLQLLSRARHLAGLDRRQSWAVLPIVGFLGLALTVNLAIALALIPQLVRMLTGYESEFSRSGPYFVFTPLFLWSTVVISWMVFDPFTQAVYCLRCFHGESLTTGEDIRAGLRLLTAGAAVLLALLLPLHSFAAVPPPPAAVSPQRLEQSVRQAMQSPAYDWRLPVPAAAAPQNVPWLVRVTDRFIDGVQSVVRAIGKAIDRFFDWLRQILSLTPAPRTGAMPSAGLHWGLYILIGFVAFLAAWIAWRRRWFRRARPKPVAAPGLEAIRLDAGDLSADRLPEERWLELAARSLQEENFRFALRAFYLANLAYLGRSRFLTIHPGKTNREYELELRRKARAFAEARDLFAVNVAAFERAWYGLHEVGADDVSGFRQRIDRIKAALAAPQGAAA